MAESTHASPAPLATPLLSSSAVSGPVSTTASLYPACRDLKVRLTRVPNFAMHFLEPSPRLTENELIEYKETSAHPVSHLWYCFRLGSPLCFLFNQLGSTLQQPRIPDFPDAQSDNLRSCKMATMAFLKAMIKLGTDLKAQNLPGWGQEDLFTVTELLASSTAGLVKVRGSAQFIMRLKSLHCQGYQKRQLATRLDGNA